MQQLTIEISNIHCEDCEQAILSCLGDVFSFAGSPSSSLPPVKVQITNDQVVTVTCKDNTVLPRLYKPVLSRIEHAGLIVEEYELYDMATDVSLVHHRRSAWSSPWSLFFGERQRVRVHNQHCSKCRNQDQEASSSTSTTVAEGTEYRAVFALAGMTCASCANTVTNSIIEVLRKYLHNGTDPICSVDLIKSSAVAIIPNKQVANIIIQEVKEAGYSATLVEVLPVERETRFRVQAAIGGMTCASCASSISTAVQSLPFLEEHSISVVSKSGVFILDSDDQDTISKLKSAVEDCGFDFEVIDISEISHASTKKLTRTVNLKIKGMYCEHCPDAITEILKHIGDSVVIEDPITLEHPFVKLTYIPSPPSLTIRSVLQKIRDKNFEVEVVQDVTLDEHLRRMAKAETAKISSRLVLTSIVSIPTLVFGMIGMSLPHNNKFRMWLDEPLFVGNVSRMDWILFILATPVYFFADDIFHKKAITEISALWKHNVSWKRRFFRFGSMNLLMSLGTTVSYVASIILLWITARQVPSEHGHGSSASYFDSVVFLTFFLLIGRLLESYSKTKTAQAITDLGTLKPSTAILLTRAKDGTYDNDQVVPINLLEVGDFIRIVPGGSPPVDCIVAQGEAQFDESALTGESIPVLHTSGEQIFAGTVSRGPHAIIAKLSALEGTSLLDNIVNTVRDGQMNKAPIEKSADVLTSYFVPLITFLAILTWIVWFSLGYFGFIPESYRDNEVGGWAAWSLEFAIAVFVIACPCGIGLAAPTALFVGGGLAAQNGILARGGGMAFQQGSKVNVVCFDKTGTLTVGGEPRITNFALHHDKSIRTFALQVSRDLEVNSSHPLAKAVKSFVDHTSNRLGVQLSQVKVPEIHEIAGKGLAGEVHLDSAEPQDSLWNQYKPTAVLLGNERLMEENDVTLSSKQQRLLNDWKAQGKSIVIIALQCQSFFKTDAYVPVLLLACRDEIRPEAKSVIEELKKSGIQVWMISGDNTTTATTIAKEVGIDNVIAEVLPEEKATRIKWIRETNLINNKPPVIAMVGDGINDAPALSTADVGIALASGSDLALTSSDFVLLSPSHPLVTLLTLLKLSKKVFLRVYFNFGWAICYNAIGIPIAAGIFYPINHARLSPVWASAAMALSSISVVLSSLALKWFKRPQVVLGLEKLGDLEAVEQDL